MISTLIALVVAGLSFPGGQAEALAKSISEATRKPVAVMPVLGVGFRKFSITSSDLADIHRLIQSKGSTHATRKGVFGFGPAGWPHEFFFKTFYNGKYEKELRVDPKPLVKSGKGFSWEPGDSEYLSLNSLSPTIGPISWHPFFNEVRFSLAVKDATENEIIFAVASAIGAKPVAKKGGWYFDLDVAALRSRAIRMCEAGPIQAKEPFRAMEAANLKYLAELFRSLTDRQIKAYYDGADGYVTVRPGHPIHRAAMARIDSALMMSTPTKSHVVRGSIAPLLQKIDPERPVLVSLRRDGTASCDYYLRDGSVFGF